MFEAARLFPGAAMLGVLFVSACTDVKPDSHDPHSGLAMNYHVIDHRLSTGGHFVGDGLDQLADEGFEVVIDLRGSPPEDQQQRLSRHGVKYVSVYVDWDDPQPEQFDNFKVAMSRYADDKLFVQCGANYRASAMTYLYQVLVDGVSEQQARKDLIAVWEPNKTWSKYIETVKQQHPTQF